MDFSPATAGRRYLVKRSLRKRYGDVSDKTIERWVEKKILPEPDLVIGRIKYWSEERLDENDRAMTAAAAKAAAA